MNLPALTFELPWLAASSLRLALVLAAFLLARPLLRRLIGSAWLSVLWLGLLVRLLAPWPLATPFGWERGASQSAAVAVGTVSGYEVKARVIEDGAGVEVAAPMTAKPGANRAGWREIWLAGVALGIAALALRMVRTSRLARRTEAARDVRLLTAFAKMPEALRRGVTLRETDALSVPTLAGLVRPQIWMPRAWLAQLSDTELRHVLLHELGHARRRDLLVQWLFSLAVCLHWFNPLVWLAARCARADREMACDAWVLARSRNVAPDEYGATLLKTIELLREPLRLAPHAIAMAASKRGLFTRIATLGGFRTRPAWRGVACLFALAAALAVFTTARLGAQPSASPAPAGPEEGAKPITKENIDAQLDWEDTGLPPGATSADPAKPLPRTAHAPQIEISSRFIEVTDSAAKALSGASDIAGAIFGATVPATGGVVGLLTDDKVKTVLDALAQAKGSDVLSTPRVITTSGQRAVIEIIREFRYPTEFDRDDKTPPNITPKAFETRNLGITLEVEPSIGPDGKTIDLNLAPQVVELTGYNRIGPGGASTIVKVPAGTPSGGNTKGVTTGPGEMLQPIFSTRKVTTNVTIFDGQTVVLGGMRKEGDIDEKGRPVEPRQLVIFITAKIINVRDAPNPKSPQPSPAAQGASPGVLQVPPAAAAPMPPTPAPGEGYAKAVSGKPGFVTSPHAPAAGYIDVRGLPPGTEVRCPYSGKNFLVP